MGRGFLPQGNTIAPLRGYRLLWVILEVFGEFLVIGLWLRYLVRLTILPFILFEVAWCDVYIDAQCSVGGAAIPPYRPPIFFLAFCKGFSDLKVRGSPQKMPKSCGAAQNRYVFFFT
ncbi:hypothetical protein [Nostoc sp. WHI]|uniref:hypothetical protein n=1 Tax=Nostoc sp. WHI TaxID=2650611 RepID=UPI0018C6ADCF|nr:hypothetical protein [Nostoc sp. WHI]MBG1265499.1 hypothetical protein [Nostoc sp. WHI]MBG1265524.1 hypothetical protein [Nostoc sp. WHI]